MSKPTLELDEQPTTSDEDDEPSARRLARLSRLISFSIDEDIDKADYAATVAIQEALEELEKQRAKRQKLGPREQARERVLDQLRIDEEDLGPERLKVEVLHRRKRHYLERRALLHGLTDLFAILAFGCYLVAPA